MSQKALPDKEIILNVLCPHQPLRVWFLTGLFVQNGWPYTTGLASRPTPGSLSPACRTRRFVLPHLPFLRSGPANRLPYTGLLRFSRLQTRLHQQWHWLVRTYLLGRYGAGVWGPRRRRQAELPLQPQDLVLRPSPTALPVVAAAATTTTELY